MQLKTYYLLLIIFLFTILQSCATFQSQYKRDVKEWDQDQFPDPALIEHTLYLIGDAGKSPKDRPAPAIRLLGDALKTAGENSTTIFLGDNIYPDGLPPEDDKRYTDAKYNLDRQLEILKNYKGDSYFIPGNHDWVADGYKAVNRQEEYIEDYLDKKKVFLPKNGCSGPEVVKVTDNLTYIFIDTQWWIVNWDEQPGINDGCDAKNKDTFIGLLDSALKKNRDKTVVLALHHPLYSNGSHGGHYSWKDHIFPFTAVNEKLYIPLPGIGTVLQQIRSNIGIRQDVNYPLLADLKQEILNLTKGMDNIIFASGHDHNLQYIEAGGHPFVVSGAGSKEAAAKASGNVLFSHGSYGFAKINFYKDGSAWISYYKTEKDAAQAELVFRKKILDALERDIPTSFPEYEQNLDSIQVSLYSEEVTEKGGMHRFLWGELYRDVYSLGFKVPTLDLSEIKGGLTPIRKGGGNQTNSLRLEAKDGRQYVLRSMQKDAGRIMGGVLRGTFVVDLMRDVFTFSHPYAAFVVPALADAAGIYHTNPKLYYVPKQPALGTYNDLFGGGLYLFEERPADDRTDVKSFGYSEEIISTPDLVQKLQRNHKHRVDQAFLIRSRLFDMTIGDWDRHSDQWRWASFDDEGGGTYYRPIPRDRDQPFSKFDGVLMQIINKTVPLARQFQSYGEEIPNIKWYNNYARFFDQAFLNQLTWEEWEKEVEHIQKNLTDEAIESALAQWPKVVYEANGEEIMRKMKGRRNNLMKIARDYYEVLAKKVVIVGTNKNDRFEVERGEGQTTVRLYILKKGKKKDKMYERTFRHSETKEVQLYGLDGDDEFEIDGEANSGILVRAIGGRDKDVFDDDSSVKGWSKKTKIYDTIEGNKVKDDNEIKDHRSDRYILNEYDFKDKDVNYAMILPVLGFNPDDGNYLGAFIDIYRFGFKKKPYAQKHRIGGNYAFATQAVDFYYQPEFVNVFGKWDLLFDIEWRSPQYVDNFFGLGNESINRDLDDLSFHRVRKSVFFAYPALRYTFRNGGYFRFSGAYERHKIERTANRFIVSDFSSIREENFDDQYFAGADAMYFYENYDSPAAPTKGFKFALKVGWRTNLIEEERHYSYIASSIALYQKLVPNGSLVFASEVGGQHNFGEFEFYQAAIIGGQNSLRGFRQERFAGDASFYQSTDLRLRLFNNAKTYIAPISFGIFGSFDYGRVWLEEEESGLWHHSFGSGLWVSTLDFICITGSLQYSNEGNRLIIQSRFNF